MLDSLAGLTDRMGLLGTTITVLIALVFIIGFYANILIRRRYVSLSQELAAYCCGEISEFRSETLSWITEEYRQAAASGLENINTGAVMDMALEAFEKPCILGESFLKKVNGLLVTLGLFGTFIGLTSALGSLGSMINNSDAESLMADTGVSVFRVLISSFEGMSVAFITSLFGTGFSILLSVLFTLVGAADAKKLLMIQLEEYLDIRLAADAAEETRKAENDRSEQLGFLKNFNTELEQNIDSAGKSVSALCRSLDKTAETILQSGTSLFTCAEILSGLVKEIGAENSRLEGVDGVLGSLSERLDESAQDRKIFLRAVSEIPDRLLNYSEAAVARTEKSR